MSDIESLKERYLIVKRGLYFRPNNRGYTGLKREAGRYPASHAAPDCGETAIHEDEAPEYSPACWEETRLADKDATITTLQSKLAEAERALEQICMFGEAQKIMDEPEEFGGTDDGAETLCMVYENMQHIAGRALVTIRSAPAIREDDQ